jgi:hypothetical protein
MPPVLIGPRCNRQVTCDSDPHNDRSESALAVNPTDAYNLVGSSKRFTDPATYQFSLAPYASFDGGQSWTVGSPFSLPAGEDGVSDPTVAFDDLGNAYVMGLLFRNGATPQQVFLDGMAVYRSSDGGRTWSPPNVIHRGDGDDKQSMASDTTPGSPYFGRVYAAWDYNGVAYARTRDRGATWVGLTQAGVDQAAGSQLVGNGFFSAISVAPDGSVYIFFVTSDAGGLGIGYVKSTDGGDTFGPVRPAATGITDVPSQLPGGRFRLETIPTACCGTAGNVAVAWADYRDGVARVYRRRSGDGGNSWQGGASGEILTTGTSASATDQHDFMPQLASTPAGEIGCCFYEFGNKGGGSTPLIDVVLCVSTDGGGTFPDRVNVTDMPWNPAVDAPLAHGGPVTFIGDYFGLAASPLGFFPFWTDTRTGIQEIFTSRLAVSPADVYIRDSSSDTGGVPSPGDHWEAPDLIVSRSSTPPAGWTNDPLVHDSATNFYVYGRARNLGPNAARNVRLAVTVGNFPGLEGMPGTEFRYPQDWYPGDWDTAALQHNHLHLGESAPVSIPPGGGPVVLGPVLWPAAHIPVAGTWHPCLLAEVRADNDDSLGGGEGCAPQVGVDPCNPGSYFWQVNNACQRNLTDAPIPELQTLEFPVIIGSRFGDARFVDVMVERSEGLEALPMTLLIRPLGEVRGTDAPAPRPGILVKETAHLAVLSGDEELGDLWAAPGSIWRPATRRGLAEAETRVVGAVRDGEGWRLTHDRASVGVAIESGELHLATLRVDLRGEGPHRGMVRVLQRNDRRVVTGSVTLVLGSEPKPQV